MTRIDTRSPERAWPPFMDWLRSEGLDPSNLRGIDFDEVSLDAIVTELSRRNGRFYADGDELVTTQRRVKLSTSPPRRRSVA